jgi:hypothetical protein
MTPRLDRWGEPIEDDSEPPRARQSPRTRDEIHTERCAQLRAIIRAARERREAQQ